MNDYEDFEELSRKKTMTLMITDNMGEVQEIIEGLDNINKYLTKVNDKINKD